jgi:dipeptidyl aminopeptidase/acylaminoacyl peptidase
VKPLRRRVGQQASGFPWVLTLVIGIPVALVLICGGGALVVYQFFKREEVTTVSAVSLREARAGHTTKLIRNSFKPDGAAAVPPANVCRLVKYPSPAGNLAAYLSPDPGDGQKHPALVWAHGGFGGIGEDAWDADGDIQPFRDAGVIVLCPSWRGENDNPGKFELFYGEVEDAVAAIEYVSRLPYVDPGRIYLGGHSTGGTLALLAAESTTKVRATFAFGGAPNMANVVKRGGYGNTPYSITDSEESRLRSSIHFVRSLASPTFYFEGEESDDYLEDVRNMERLAQQVNAPFQAFIVADTDHFGVVEPVNKLLALKIKADRGPRCTITLTAHEVQKAFDDADP